MGIKTVSVQGYAECSNGSIAASSDMAVPECEMR